jgi:hypothetical protein
MHEASRKERAKKGQWKNAQDITWAKEKEKNAK